MRHYDFLPSGNGYKVRLTHLIVPAREDRERPDACVQRGLHTWIRRFASVQRSQDACGQLVRALELRVSGGGAIAHGLWAAAE